MPITDHFLRIPLSSITVERDSRQRKEVDTKGLKESIAKNGVLSPIIVKRGEDQYDVQSDTTTLTYVLVAGERRYTACAELGLIDIPTRLVESLSPIELSIIELEENVKREDLTWKDLVSAVAKIHTLYTQLDPDWTLSETAEAISFSTGTISMYLTVHSDWDDIAVQNAGTVREAYNLLLRRQQRAEGDALQELLDESPIKSLVPIPIDDLPPGIEPPKAKPITTQSIQLSAADHIIQADFLAWAPLYDGPKFNLIHCDFPYGVGLFSSNGVRSGPNRSQMGRDIADNESYNDDPKLYQSLVECLCVNLDRIASVSCHIMFWYSAKPEIDKWTRETFARLAPSIGWARFPLIWVKSDNAGIAADPTHEPRHVYETCLLGSRGRRQIVKIVSDAYNAPTDKSIHTSAKPVPVLKHFMGMLVDRSTTIFDPTCGSGNALRAAEALGAPRIMGLEIDGKMVGMAQGALRNDRLKRVAEGYQPSLGV